MKPHEIALLVQEESSKLVPDQARIDSLIEDLDDLVGRERAAELLRQPQSAGPTIH